MAARLIHFCMIVTLGLCAGCARIAAPDRPGTEGSERRIALGQYLDPATNPDALAAARHTVLLRTEFPNRKDPVLCTAVLVSHRAALTASSCLSKTKAATKAELLFHSGPAPLAYPAPERTRAVTSWRLGTRAGSNLAVLYFDGGFPPADFAGTYAAVPLAAYQQLVPDTLLAGYGPTAPKALDGGVLRAMRTTAPTKSTGGALRLETDNATCLGDAGAPLFETLATGAVLVAVTTSTECMSIPTLAHVATLRSWLTELVPEVIFHSLVNVVVTSPTGRVTSTPTGLDCGSACRGTFPLDMELTLTAEGAGGAAGVQWSGCTASGPRCSLALSRSVQFTVSADFPKERLPLEFTSLGQGNGSVSFDSPGLDRCFKKCSFLLEAGTRVTVTAAAEPGSFFAGWESSCPEPAGTTCRLPMDSNRKLVARFVRPLLTVGLNGAGSVTSQPPGIACGIAGGACEASFAPGTAVTLSAGVPPGARVQWRSPSCAEGTVQCTVIVNDKTSLSARITQPQLRVQTALKDAAGQQLTQNFTLPDYTEDTMQYALGTLLQIKAKAPTLNSNPSSGKPPVANFLGWAGCDKAIGSTCFVAMNDDRTVTAYYEASPPSIGTQSGSKFPLTVQITGPGTVTSNVPGIYQCTSDCTNDYFKGTKVVLVATADKRSVFSKWTGCDQANGLQCTVRVKEAATVQAHFTSSAK